MTARVLIAGLLGLIVASQAAGPATAPATPAAIVSSIFEPATGSATRPSAAVAYIVGASEPAFAFFGTKTLSDPSKTPDRDTIYEIGSITKGLTGILLADMAARGELSIHDTLGALLPDGAAYPEAIRQITLVQLATHASGLPRLPGDLFVGADQSNPYAHYDAGRLLSFLRGYTAASASGPITPTYSNLGFGLLGYVLAQKAGMPYEQLLKTRLLDPLGMRDTSIVLTDAQRARLATGHAGGVAVANWDLTGALAGAGAVRSTAGDMAKLLAALMHPPATDLGKAITIALEPRGDLGASKIGFAWITSTAPDGTTYTWHNGGTGGYRTFIGFTGDKRAGIVALTNVGDEGADALAVQALTRLAQR